MQHTGLFDILRWWALCGYTVTGLYEFTEGFKISAGQSSFARAFFDEAFETGNLEYSFDTVVTTIEDQEKQVTVNQAYVAKRLICTIPLNVLNDIVFTPLLPQAKSAACGGNINRGSKVHLEVRGDQLRPWAGGSYAATCVLGTLLIVLYFVGTCNVIAAASRQCWAFAR